MVVSRENRNWVQEEVIKVEEYRFKSGLIQILTQNNDINAKISMSLLSVNKCFFGLYKIFKSKVISKNLKVRMYLTSLRPFSLYGAKTWLLRKTKELSMAVFKR